MMLNWNGTILGPPHVRDFQQYGCSLELTTDYLPLDVRVPTKIASIV